MAESIRTRIDGMASAIDLSQLHELRLSRVRQRRFVMECSVALICVSFSFVRCLLPRSMGPACSLFGIAWRVNECAEWPAHWQRTKGRHDRVKIAHEIGAATSTLAAFRLDQIAVEHEIKMSHNQFWDAEQQKCISVLFMFSASG